MERNEATNQAEEIAELYDAIYHLTKVVNDLTRVIMEHDKTNTELARVLRNVDNSIVDLQQSTEGIHHTIAAVV